jgi:hypothetical protein
VERWLTARDPKTGTARPKWDVTIPGPVLGGLAIVGLIAFSVIGAFVYYPDRDQCLKDMVVLRTEAQVAVMTGQTADATRAIEEWDLVSRKLEVGVFLRTWRLAGEQSAAGEELREALEEVRDAVRYGHAERAKKLFQLRPDERRLRDAVLAGDWAAAAKVVTEVDDSRRKQAAEASATKPPTLFSAEIGALWPAIQAGDAAAARAALAELGYGEHTVTECYEELKRVFPAE